MHDQPWPPNQRPATALNPVSVNVSVNAHGTGDGTEAVVLARLTAATQYLAVPRLGASSSEQVVPFLRDQTLQDAPRLEPAHVDVEPPSDGAQAAQ